MRKGVLTGVFIRAAFVAAAAALLVGGWQVASLLIPPSPFEARGWICDRATGHCSPEGGNWQGLRVGMSRSDALQAACGLLSKGLIAQPPSPSQGSLPVHMEGISCKPNAYELSLKPADEIADPAGVLDIWLLYPSHMWCFPNLEHQQVWVEFDKRLRVKSITSSCRQIII